MAVTVLKNLKESKIRGDPANHLRRAIYYIMNPDKTDNYRLTFSNCGISPEGIFEAMLLTKEDYQKSWGRQGYHFVISFSPGECDENTAMKVGKDFCDQYLGDSYDYCFAVHNDHPHIHIHIVFNSVSRLTGLKYRYVDGDWEKYIQPVTDSICLKYGLSELVYDKNEKRIGKSYAEHSAEKNNHFTWSKIIRADIDQAITQSDDISDFFNIMKRYGYDIRIGTSKSHGKYVAYSHSGLNSEKGKKAHRDYSLGDDYTYDRIEERIALKESVPKTYIVPNDSDIPFIPRPKKYKIQIALYSRYKQAYLFHSLDLQVKEQIRVRRDLIHITEIADEATYVIKNNLFSYEDCDKRLHELNAELKKLRDEKNLFNGNLFSEDEISDRSEYFRLCDRLSRFETSLSDSEFENISDKIESLRAKYKDDPMILSNTRNSAEYKSLCDERRILRRILRNKPITDSVRIDVKNNDYEEKDIIKNESINQANGKKKEV